MPNGAQPPGPRVIPVPAWPALAPDPLDPAWRRRMLDVAHDAWRLQRPPGEGAGGAAAPPYEPHLFPPQRNLAGGFDAAGFVPGGPPHRGAAAAVRRAAEGEPQAAGDDDELLRRLRPRLGAAGGRRH